MANSGTVPTSAIFPGNGKYIYNGCYNETTLINGTGGQRALAGGIMESLDTMTVETCLDYCSTGAYKYAGLEYTSECWCAQHINAFSNKLPDSSCNLYCKGNSSQVCGGNLVLTTYIQQTASGSVTAPVPAKLLAALLGVSWLVTLWAL